MKDAEGYCCEFDNDPDDPEENGTLGHESWHFKRLCPHCKATFWSLHCCHEHDVCHACNVSTEPLPDGVYDADGGEG